MPTVDALQRLAVRAAAEADRLSALFATQLAKVFRQTEVDLRDWLRVHQPRPTPKARREIQQLLQRAGFEDLVTVGTLAPFDRLAAQILAGRDVARLGIKASAASAKRLEAIRRWHLENLLIEESVIARSLGDAVMRGGGRRRLPEDLRHILDLSEARVQTLYDTALSVYGRQVEAEHAGDNPTTPFVYMGPVDAKTRDFCLRHVGKVYTREEIDALDNGQISNVFLTGGGYNCRHVFQEISPASELFEQRSAPEIRDAVAQIKEAA